MEGPQMAALRWREASCATQVTLPPFQHMRSIHDWRMTLIAAVLEVLLSQPSTQK